MKIEDTTTCRILFVNKVCKEIVDEFKDAREKKSGYRSVVLYNGGEIFAEQVRGELEQRLIEENLEYFVHVARPSKHDFNVDLNKYNGVV